ncbi:D-alanine--D-alanine ligase [Candidatus Kaiserbacteria bacterium]|nr:D-alanine--D-alanine ligase [Candidatus Kaiserbacteria bacterium]
MKRVAVLRGGPSEEYAVSLQSGNSVLHALKQLEYPHRDIVITKQGEWLESGFVRQPERALEAVDVVFIALHGSYGEDGQVQRILERNAIPFTGSRALASAIAFNKELTKQTIIPYNIRTPHYRRVSRREAALYTSDVSEIFSDLGPELFLKPVSNGSSLGARHVPSEADLKVALDELLALYDQVLIEEYIRGREATVGVLGDFRGKELYTLPVIEIVPPAGTTLFTHEDKYNGHTEEIVPGRFSYHEKALMSEIAQQVHDLIGCSHYSRSDFIVRDGEVYFLEVNTLPGLTSESLFPKAAAAIGLEFPQLIEHLVETARV